MFNDCHCVVGLRLRYERIFLMGCGTSSQCACREKLFSSEYRNVYYLYGSKPHPSLVTDHPRTVNLFILTYIGITGPHSSYKDIAERGFNERLRPSKSTHTLSANFCVFTFASGSGLPQSSFLFQLSRRQLCQLGIIDGEFSSEGGFSLSYQEISSICSGGKDLVPRLVVAIDDDVGPKGTYVRMRW